MRRGLALLATTAIVAVSGCGGDDSGSALDEALGYLPADAPAVIVVETDRDHDQWKQVNKLISKFPVAGQIREGARRELAPEPLDFDDDVRPQIGSEVVFAVQDAEGNDPFVLTAKLKDTDRAERDILPKLKESGYAAQIDGEMLVVSDDPRALSAALKQADEDDGLTEDEFEDDLGRLAEGDPLLRGTVDVEKALEAGEADPEVKAIPWVGSVRTVAFAAGARESGLAFDFDIETEANPDDVLPLAPGPQAPPVPRREGEIAVAAREPGRTLGLAERIRGVAPRTKAHSAALDDALERIDVDVERDLIAHIGAVGAVSFRLDGSHVARADLKDPAAFADTLEKLSDELPGAARGDIGFTIEPGGGAGFYRLNADHGRQVFVGVVGDQVVLGREAGRARDFADDPAQPVPGARGSVALFADTQSVANALIDQQASGPEALFGQAFTDPLGDLRGWIETKPTGTTGHAELEIE